VVGAGHAVDYSSASQFTREYRRLFGAPPGQDAARLQGSRLVVESPANQAQVTQARRLTLIDRDVRLAPFFATLPKMRDIVASALVGANIRS
jgi:hypothetical protein